jgi:hypothetical protein
MAASKGSPNAVHIINSIIRDKWEFSTCKVNVNLGILKDLYADR